MASKQKSGSNGSPRKKRVKDKQKTLDITVDHPSYVPLFDPSSQSLTQIAYERDFWKSANLGLVDQLRHEIAQLKAENEELKNELLQEKSRYSFLMMEHDRTCRSLSFTTNELLEHKGNGCYIGPYPPPLAVNPNALTIPSVNSLDNNVSHFGSVQSEEQVQFSIASLMEAINSLAPAERAPSPVPIESPGSQTMDEDEEEEEDKETEHDDFDDLQYPIVEVKEAPPDEPSVFSPLPVDNPQVLSRPFTLDSIFSIKRSESPKAAFSPSMSLATQLEACSLTTPPLRDQHEAPTQNTSPTTPQKPIFKKPAYPTPPRNEYTMFFYDLLETSINLLTSGEDMVGYECTLCLRDSKKSRGTFPEEVKPKILVEHYRNLHPNHYNKVVRGIRTQMK